MNKLKIGIILGSTRVGRKSPEVGGWVLEKANVLSDDIFEIIDINDYNIPFFGTEQNNESISRWKETISQYDGFIFVVQEYNHSITGALKNALDSAYEEWNNKAAGIVSY